MTCFLDLVGFEKSIELFDCGCWPDWLNWMRRLVYFTFSCVKQKHSSLWVSPELRYEIAVFVDVIMFTDANGTKLSVIFYMLLLLLFSLSFFSLHFHRNLSLLLCVCAFSFYLSNCCWTKGLRITKPFSFNSSTHKRIAWEMFALMVNYIHAVMFINHICQSNFFPSISSTIANASHQTDFIRSFISSFFFIWDRWNTIY